MPDHVPRLCSACDGPLTAPRTCTRCGAGYADAARRAAPGGGAAGRVGRTAQRWDPLGMAVEELLPWTRGELARW